MSRLVCVSNRLPLGPNPAGGLVVALKSALTETGGLWVGYRGEVTETPSDSLIDLPGAPFERAAFDLTQEEFDGYYRGYANSELWPIFHGRADLCDIRPEHLETYRAVNARIARQLAPRLRRDDRIWVHDFHLLPLAQELRRLGVEAPIGLFLHIPFPDVHNLSALSNGAEVIDWLSRYDLVGLQADRDVLSFLDCAWQLGNLEDFGKGRLKVNGRHMRIASCPIGIDAEEFAAAARDAPREDRLRSLTGAELMIGVDRLDYSKGIPQRFRAFQELLEQHEDLHEKIAFLQIAPPTREAISAYQVIREETEHLAGRINGQFATINWTPIRYIHRPLPRDTLAGLYRQAAIGLVTPLADGMNLVAKEYVAAQDPEDPGVLILSRFAGAAEMMGEALIINPHDPCELALAMAEALHMPRTERRRRWERLMHVVQTQDVRWWSKRFLSALERQPIPA
ncbi:trehalose-6-phosphate synthase [Rhodobacteraceae bacterium 2CG4]|uniref:Trehalose-6-phosphate synthase n=1 Tax=Halovulum marinum TaxID=2662447 RepID=A0A6L5YZ71_9RHOB|nr:trehalose-6-phosphate synthase [Halovulum marinum]MSU89162.1 trehalose-6-phosphate synthase [Halovulum marinum]